MFNFLVSCMVVALFCHTFMNFFLKVYTYLVTKVTGVAVAEHSVEVFFGKLFGGIFNFFKSL